MNPRPATQRSRITNGRIVLEGVDNNTPAARRLKDLIAGLAADVGGDLGEIELQQVRTAACAILHSEQLSAAVVRGEPVSSEEVTRAANVAARLLNALKRRRKPQPRGAALSDYLAKEHAA